MKERQVPNFLWDEAVSIAIYLINRSPTEAVQGGTSYKALTSMKPYVKHLRIFGCLAYMMISSKQLRKLDPKSEKLVFVNYCTVSKSCRLYNPIINNVHKQECHVWWRYKLAVGDSSPSKMKSNLLRARRFNGGCHRGRKATIRSWRACITNSKWADEWWSWMLTHSIEV